MRSMCKHVHRAYLGLRSGAGDAQSQFSILQHLYLICLWNISALLQAGAVDQEGCCGFMLHLKGLKMLQPMFNG